MTSRKPLVLVSGAMSELPSGDTLNLGVQPAFSARIYGSQTIASAYTDTKIEFSAENFDTNSCYDNTLYRFTPTTPGYYCINATIMTPGAAGGGVLRIYKNGSLYRQIAGGSSSSELTMSGSILMYLNGTDYIEAWCYLLAAGSYVMGSSAELSNFDAFFVRA